MSTSPGASSRHYSWLAVSATATVALALILAAAAGAAGPTTPGEGVATVSPADKAAAETQFDKANALYKQDKYPEAQVENDKALKLDPTNTNALLMRRILEAKIAAGSLATATQGGAASTAPAGRVPLLTTQQLSVVRLMELGPADNRVTGRVDAKVLNDFWQNVIANDPFADKSNTAKNAFLNPANFMLQAGQIRAAHVQKYIDQVTVTSDPAVFLAYRNNIQTFVLQKCASADCHSERAPAANAGNFRLANPATSPETQYTNFYILSNYANADGKMIDRATPEKSLLIQYALPWSLATLKHPKVDVKRLTGPNDPLLQTTMQWIAALNFPKPTYGISYTVPGMETTTASAPAPAPETSSRPATAPKP